VPVSDLLGALVRDCAPHARGLGCVPELAGIAGLSASSGAMRQRAAAARPEGLPGVLRMLHEEFTAASRPAESPRLQSQSAG